MAFRTTKLNEGNIRDDIAERTDTSKTPVRLQVAPETEKDFHFRQIDTRNEVDRLLDFSGTTRVKVQHSDCGLGTLSTSQTEFHRKDYPDITNFILPTSEHIETRKSDMKDPYDVWGLGNLGNTLYGRLELTNIRNQKLTMGEEAEFRQKMRNTANATRHSEFADEFINKAKKPKHNAVELGGGFEESKDRDGDGGAGGYEDPELVGLGDTAVVHAPMAPPPPISGNQSRKSTLIAPKPKSPTTSAIPVNPVTTSGSPGSSPVAIPAAYAEHEKRDGKPSPDVGRYEEFNKTATSAQKRLLRQVDKEEDDIRDLIKKYEAGYDYSRDELVALSLRINDWHGTAGEHHLPGAHRRNIARGELNTEMTDLAAKFKVGKEKFKITEADIAKYKGSKAKATEQQITDADVAKHEESFFNSIKIPAIPAGASKQQYRDAFKQITEGVDKMFTEGKGKLNKAITEKLQRRISKAQMNVQDIKIAKTEKAIEDNMTELEVSSTAYEQLVSINDRLKKSGRATTENGIAKNAHLTKEERAAFLANIPKDYHDLFPSNCTLKAYFERIHAVQNTKYNEFRGDVMHVPHYHKVKEAAAKGNYNQRHYYEPPEDNDTKYHKLTEAFISLPEHGDVVLNLKDFRKLLDKLPEDYKSKFYSRKVADIKDIIQTLREYELMKRHDEPPQKDTNDLETIINIVKQAKAAQRKITRSPPSAGKSAAGAGKGKK
jgi:hypothetical protein